MILFVVGFTRIGGVCMVWRCYWVILTFTGSGEWIIGFVDEWIDARRREDSRWRQARLGLWSDLLGLDMVDFLKIF